MGHGIYNEKVPQFGSFYLSERGVLSHDGSNHGRRLLKQRKQCVKSPVVVTSHAYICQFMLLAFHGGVSTVALSKDSVKLSQHCKSLLNFTSAVAGPCTANIGGYDTVADHNKFFVRRAMGLFYDFATPTSPNAGLCCSTGSNHSCRL